MSRILSVCFVFFICCQFTPGQEEDNSFPSKPFEQIKPPYCEFNVRKMQGLSEKVGSKNLLIVVSHLGKGEKAVLGVRRLYNAKTYFTRIDISPEVRSPDSVITAQGDAVDGEGFLDFYVKGHLELRVYINKNADFIVTSCIEDPRGNVCASSYEQLYYPCKVKTK